jgi:hypothetical protein
MTGGALTRLSSRVRSTMVRIIRGFLSDHLAIDAVE